MKYTTVIILIFTCSCNGQVKSEIENAKSIVSEAEGDLNSEESIQIFLRIEQANETTHDLIDKINQSKSEQLISSKDTILFIYGKLIDFINYSTEQLTEKHGTDQNGELKDKMNTRHVNKLFIEEEIATSLKQQILKTIERSLEVVQKNEIDLSMNDLPLKLNLFMEQEGTSWEEYLFKDMPALAVLPILKKYKNDGILTKLTMLEELAKKHK